MTTSCETSREMNVDRRLLIDRVSFLDHPPHRALGVRPLEQGSIGTTAYPGEKDFKVGLEPDRDPSVADRFAGFGVDEGAAAGGDHSRAAAEQTLDHTSLARAKELLAILLEDLFDGGIGGSFDFRIGVHERDCQTDGEPFTDRTFAGAHHAN